MKQIIFEKPYQPFFLTGLILFCIAFFIIGVYPDSLFELSIYNRDFSTSTAKIWFAFSGYLFFLALIYYIIFRNSLRTKRWLVISHYTFIVFFLILFAIFSVFPNPWTQNLMSGISLAGLIAIYGIIFLADFALFVAGIFLLIINLFSLKH